ncbi:MAG: cytochrome c oxidase subunit II [Coleofasciculaceae cyanobacterium]
MKKVFDRILLAFFIAANLLISRWIGQQAFNWMPSQATAESKQVDNLFSFLTSVGAFIFIGLTGMILYSVIFFRAPPDDWSHGHPARQDWRLEAAWTIIPLILVMWLAVQSYKIYQQLHLQGLAPIVHLHLLEEPANAQSFPTEQNTNGQPGSNLIEVTAKQWSWTFRYPGNNVTSNELHLPVNQSVQLKLQSEDVLHGFYVPEFRVKQDIIPNRAITFTFTPLLEGKYRLNDSQFSGTYFSLMEADVIVESLDAYNQWLTEAATQTPTATKNPAFAEHEQRLKKGDKGWITVPPAAPPVVNYAS